jgi:predicted GIY-YIG superfamily endonuclease
MSKQFVYVLKNGEVPPRYYTGITADVAKRHAAHNAGCSVHTAKYRPWSVDVVIEFANERRALAFEHYLKSGSGVAFASSASAIAAVI